MRPQSQVPVNTAAAQRLQQWRLARAHRGMVAVRPRWVSPLTDAHIVDAHGAADTAPVTR